MAGLQEVSISDLARNVANGSEMVNNGIDEKDLVENEDSLSEEELEELKLTNPVLYEQVQLGGEVSA